MLKRLSLDKGKKKKKKFANVSLLNRKYSYFVGNIYAIVKRKKYSYFVSNIYAIVFFFFFLS